MSGELAANVLKGLHGEWKQDNVNTIVLLL